MAGTLAAHLGQHAAIHRLVGCGRQTRHETSSPELGRTPPEVRMDFRSRCPSSALLPFFGEGSTTKIDYREKGTLVLTSLLEDLLEDLETFFGAASGMAFVGRRGSCLWSQEGLRT